MSKDSTEKEKRDFIKVLMKRAGKSKEKSLKKAEKGGKLVGNSHLDNHGVNSPAMKASKYYKGEFKK